MNQKTLKLKQQQLEKLRNELLAVVAAKRRAENRKLSGRFYKYRNSFGDGRSWWLYRKITGAGLGIKSFEFQIMADGRYEARYNYNAIHDPAWIEINKMEFDSAWRRFRFFVNAMYSAK